MTPSETVSLLICVACAACAGTARAPADAERIRIELEGTHVSIACPPGWHQDDDGSRRIECLVPRGENGGQLYYPRLGLELLPADEAPASLDSYANTRAGEIGRNVAEPRKLEVAGRKGVAMALEGETYIDYVDGSGSTGHVVGYEILLEDSTGYYRCTFDRGKTTFSAADLELTQALCSTIRFSE